jgi:hypothetical protein
MPAVFVLWVVTVGGGWQGGCVLLWLVVCGSGNKMCHPPAISSIRVQKLAAVTGVPGSVNTHGRAKGAIISKGLECYNCSWLGGLINCGAR